MSLVNGNNSFMAKKRLRQAVFIGMAAFLLVLTPLASQAAISTGADALSLIGHKDYAGQGEFADNFTNTNGNDAIQEIGLQTPFDTVIDETNHRLFVSDTENNRVLVHLLASDNTLPDVLPDYVLGQPDWVTTSSGVSQSKMYYPQGLSVDESNQRLFVADTANNRVLVYDLSGGITDGMNATSVLGQADFTASSVATSASGMRTPRGVEYAASIETLFVADAVNSRVLAFDLSGTITDGMSADNVLGQTDFVTGTAGNSAGEFYEPRDVTWIAGDSLLIVSDTRNSRLLAFDLSGGITDGMSAANVLGQADFTGTAAATAQNRLNWPRYLKHNSGTGLLWVTDTVNNRILAFDLSGGITDGMNASYVLGQSNYTSNTAAVSQAGLDTPYGLGLDTDNDRLYVADHDSNRIVIYDVAAVTNGEAAVGLLGHHQVDGGQLVPDWTATAADDGLRGTDVGLNLPGGLVLDEDNHRLYIAERNNNRVIVHQLDTDDELIGPYPDYVLGQPDLQTIAHGCSQTIMDEPLGIDLDRDNQRLFVADAANHRVLVYDLSGGITDGMNASYVLGQPDFTTQTVAATQSKFNFSVDVHYDAANDRLFVGDANNDRVMIFDLTGGITDGMNADWVLGQPNFTTAGNNVTQSGFSFVEGLNYDDSNKRLYVGDSFAHRIMVFDLSGGITNGMNASYVLGQSDFTSGSSGVTDSKFNTPHELEVDRANNRLVVSDYHNGRVLFFDGFDIDDGKAASYVLGKDDFTTSGGAASRSNIVKAHGVAINAAGTRMYVSDHTSDRVLYFDMSKIYGSSQATAAAVAACNVPTVTLANPNGGETARAGTEYQVLWNAQGCSLTEARIYLSTDGGESYPTLIKSGLSPTQSFWNWSVPSGMSFDTARLKIEILKGGEVTVTDESDANFSVIDPEAPELLAAEEVVVLDEAGNLPDAVPIVEELELPTEPVIELIEAPVLDEAAEPLPPPPPAETLESVVLETAALEDAAVELVKEARETAKNQPADKESAQQAEATQEFADSVTLFLQDVEKVNELSQSRQHELNKAVDQTAATREESAAATEEITDSAEATKALEEDGLLAKEASQDHLMWLEHQKQLVAEAEAAQAAAEAKYQAAYDQLAAERAAYMKLKEEATAKATLSVSQANQTLNEAKDYYAKLERFQDLRRRLEAAEQTAAELLADPNADPATLEAATFQLQSLLTQYEVDRADLNHQRTLLQEKLAELDRLEKARAELAAAEAAKAEALRQQQAAAQQAAAELKQADNQLKEKTDNAAAVNQAIVAELSPIMPIVEVVPPPVVVETVVITPAPPVLIMSEPIELIMPEPIEVAVMPVVVAAPPIMIPTISFSEIFVSPPEPELIVLTATYVEAPPVALIKEVVRTSPTSAKIRVFVSGKADGRLEYGPNPQLGTTIEIPKDRATDWVTLTDLEPGQAYFGRLKVKNTDGEFIENPVNRLGNEPIIQMLPDLEDIQVSVFRNTATISWKTDFPSTTSIEYGATEEMGEAIKLAGLRTEHKIRLSRLKEAQTYHFRLGSDYREGKFESRSDIRTFTTDPAPTYSVTAASPWSARVRFATTYPTDLQVLAGPNLMELKPVAASDTTATSHNLLAEGLLPNQTQYYRLVYSYPNQGGVTSRIQGEITTPEAIDVRFAETRGGTAYMEWRTVDSTYRIDYGRTRDMQSSISSNREGNYHHAQLTGLDFDATYFARITAIPTDGRAPAQAYAQLKTGSGAYDLNRELLTHDTAVFSWTSREGAVARLVLTPENGEPIEVTRRSSPLAQTHFVTVRDLQPETLYQVEAWSDFPDGRTYRLTPTEPTRTRPAPTLNESGQFEYEYDIYCDPAHTNAPPALQQVACELKTANPEMVENVEACMALIEQAGESAEGLAFPDAVEVIVNAAEAAQPCIDLKLNNMQIAEMAANLILGPDNLVGPAIGQVAGYLDAGIEIAVETLSNVAEAVRTGNGVALVNALQMGANASTDQIIAIMDDTKLLDLVDDPEAWVGQLGTGLINAYNISSEQLMGRLDQASEWVSTAVQDTWTVAEEAKNTVAETAEDLSEDFNDGLDNWTSDPVGTAGYVTGKVWCMLGGC
jgi:DNA-binding beta-propeller fold protein YncE